MDNSHSEQHIVSSTKKRKRGRPRKDEVVETPNITSPHTSVGQRRPIGRPRKNEGVGPSNTTSQLISSPPQKRSVGRPRKVHTTPTNDSETIVRGQFRPLILKTTLSHGTYNDPNAQLRPSLSNNSVINVPSSSQVIKLKEKAVNLLSFEGDNDSELYEYDKGNIIDNDNDENFNNSEDATDDDTVMSLAHQVYFASDVVETSANLSPSRNSEINVVLEPEFVLDGSVTGDTSDIKPPAKKRLRREDDAANKKNKSKIV